MRKLIGAVVCALSLLVAAPAAAAPQDYWLLVNNGTASVVQTAKQPSGAIADLGPVGETKDQFVAKLNAAVQAYNTAHGIPSAPSYSLNVPPWGTISAGNGAVNPAAPINAIGSIAGCVTDPTGCLTTWAISGATAVLKLVSSVGSATTSPDLTSAWFASTFQWIVLYGSLVALATAVIAIAIAAWQRSPGMLGEVLVGIWRAGWQTFVVVLLTGVLVHVADQISQDIVTAVPGGVFSTLTSSWGSSLPAALASTILGLIAALVMILFSLLLLIEFIFRDAAIYVAVLFFPIALGLSINPAWAGVRTKLLRILGMFIMFKPVALLTMFVGLEIVAGGASGQGGAASVGTVLAGIMVVALAAAAPWTLMHLLSDHAGSMYASSGGGSSKSVTGADQIGGSLNREAVAIPGESVADQGGQGMAADATGPAVSSAGSGGGKIAAGLSGAAAGVGAAIAAGQFLGRHQAARLHVASGGSDSPPGFPSWDSFGSGNGKGGMATPAALANTNGVAAGNGATATAAPANGGASTNGGSAATAPTREWHDPLDDLPLPAIYTNGKE